MVAWALGLVRVAPNALLNVAASASTPEVFRLLSAAGLEHSPTALLLAVQYGNVAFLNAVLGAGVHPDSETSLRDGWSGAHRHALTSACKSGHLSCARALLAAGADVDGPGWEGSPLAEAAREGQFECMRLLLEHRADVHARDGSGCTALMEATSAGQLECVRLLLEHSEATVDEHRSTSASAYRHEERSSTGPPCCPNPLRQWHHAHR